MKIFLKKLLSKNNIIIFLVIVFALIVRFYNFPNRVNFGPEQARSLVTSAKYIHEKPSLLGQEYFRADGSGHKIYSGAVFNYLLVPVMLISNYDPVAITAFFTVLNLATGLVIYFVAKNKFNERTAIFSMILFLFNDMMIYHSLFIWNYNLLPVIGVITFYFLSKQNKKPKSRNILILGILSGFGTSLQLLYIFVALAVYIVGIWKSKNKFYDSAIFAGGAVFGNLPMVLFDIRHNFYNFTALWGYAINTLKGVSDASFSYYYLLPFWPIAALGAGYLLSKVYKFSKVIPFILLAIYVFINLNSAKVSFQKPLGMPEGLVTADIARASKIIALDANANFNVAEDVDFDKRAYILRYYVEYLYGKKPLGEEDYVNPPVVYALLEKGYNFEKSRTWEIYAGAPYKIDLLSDIGACCGLYKLSK